jgi:gluconolactonase
MVDDLLADGADLEMLADGFGFTEGPAWHVRERCLYFSDVHGDARWRWSEAHGLELVARPSHKSNGSDFGPDLRHVVCEHVTSRVVAWGPDGTYDVLASHYGGVQLNSPNDVCVASDGTVYFSDPAYGRVAPAGVDREQELDVNGLYRVDREDGTLVLERDDFDQPNGVCLSPGERLLYANDTPRAHIRALAIASDGSLGEERVFAEGIGNGRFEDGIVDGMCCDDEGNLWTTGPGGLWAFSAEGRFLGVLEVDEPNVGNLTWGGEGWNELYLCATSRLYRIRTRVTARHLGVKWR